MKDLKPVIEYDILSTLDIRIGLIINVFEIEKTDKLYKLEVKFNDTVLTVVSGIRKMFTPEQLIGKKVPFVVNLEPRIIKGIESQAMIVIAESDKDEEDQEAPCFHIINTDAPSDSILF